MLSIALQVIFFSLQIGLHHTHDNETEMKERADCGADFGQQMSFC